MLQLICSPYYLYDLSDGKQCFSNIHYKPLNNNADYEDNSYSADENDLSDKSYDADAEDILNNSGISDTEDTSSENVSEEIELEEIELEDKNR